MKHTITSGALIIGLAVTAIAENKPAAAKAEKAAKPTAEAPAKPKVDPAAIKSDASYALGFRTGGTFGQQFGRFGVTASDLEQENFIKGFMDALKNGKPSLDEARLQAAMEGLGAMLQEREKKLAEENLAAGNKFLETNGKREGVTTTKSGLQYEVINKGGDKKYEAPKDGKDDKKQFMVNYKGTLIDGKEFDASPAGQPVPMTLEVVEGFKEALTTMPIGAKWKLFLPAKLAYGEQRRSADIGPNTTLIFELELVSIEDAPANEGMPFALPQGAEGGE
ncbi:MAG: FKBP-type peptidyl-prolyl cis-trans isomerase [Verrucomicrobia bacterium]|nr:FKBP-type peptidyl-prolyl cis-trans isomerase [Verrucomicrobiota bacterium]